MELGRCLRTVPLALIALAGALALGGPLSSVAGSQGPGVPACRGSGAPPGAMAGTAWYRLDPLLDGSGTLAGTRLLAGVAGRPVRVLTMQAEAFASGPVAGRVIAGEDNGSQSVLRAIDPARGCATVVARERGAVIRSAIATADGETLYEHRVDRTTRADQGVWRRPLDGWRAAGPAERVLDPLPPDDLYGPTFTTELRLAADGSLVVSSCGERLCRIRVAWPDGRVTVTGPTGTALGVIDGSLVTREACAGLPCPVVLHGPGGGRPRVLADNAWAAALGGVGDSTLVVEEAAGSLRAIDVRSNETSIAGGRGVLPVGTGSLATSGAAAGPGEIVLAPGGRVGDPARIRRFSAAIEEVAR